MTVMPTLNDLKPGESASVHSLCATGSMRRRLLDIGLITHTSVTCLGESPFGDPKAFLIRGAVIAIRSEDCRTVLVKPAAAKESAAAPSRKDISPSHVIALAGNPNVGKSTVFNALTGMHQHTGNWPGKTVVHAEGICKSKRHTYTLVDLPGTYSLMAHSAEEEAARNFICFSHPDAVIVVCDATCLERNLNLVLQTMEIAPKVLVCVNLMDEARRKHIHLDLPLLSKELGVPVIGTAARQKKSLEALLTLLDDTIESPPPATPFTIPYPASIEKAAASIEAALSKEQPHLPNKRWVSLKLLEQDGTTPDQLKDEVASTIVETAERICKKVVHREADASHPFHQKADRILTSHLTGFPIMLLLLALIFWITISGANYPSQLLSNALFGLQDKLTQLFFYFHAPDWLHGILVLGVYRVLAWVVSVMLPPMAIFFPLFTLLEDAGYLPRIAYNLDKPLKCCCACGKQALTMCMGFGCNAAGVVGCRIIDSKRERLLAILTNSFVPCNGRFPTFIAILTMFFVGTSGGFFSTLSSAFLLTGVIVLGVAATLLMTKLLSKTVLKGVPSSFTLELPPYRKPQIAKVLVRSVFDRTLFVLFRAIAVAAPAGMVIWLLANVSLHQVSLLHYCSSFLDPFARLMGLDGVILLAFILGFPANEIVMPIIIMAYLSEGSLLELGSLTQMHSLFVSHGWTPVTAICVILFSLFHWPCSTTLLTIKKETGSLKWTALAALLPTLTGIVTCMLVAGMARLFFV